MRQRATSGSPPHAHGSKPSSPGSLSLPGAEGGAAAAHAGLRHPIRVAGVVVPIFGVVGASRAPFIPDKRAKAGNRYRRASPPFEYGGHGRRGPQQPRDAGHHARFEIAGSGMWRTPCGGRLHDPRDGLQADAARARAAWQPTCYSADLEPPTSRQDRAGQRPSLPVPRWPAFLVSLLSAPIAERGAGPDDSCL